MSGVPKKRERVREAHLDLLIARVRRRPPGEAGYEHALLSFTLACAAIAELGHEDTLHLELSELVAALRKARLWMEPEEFAAAAAALIDEACARLEALRRAETPSSQ